MVGVSFKIIRVRKEHDIAVGGVGIDHILGSSDIIGGVIEPSKMMAVDLIIFEEDLVTGSRVTLILSSTRCFCKPVVCKLRRTILGSESDFVRQNCFDARKKMIFEFWNEVLTMN